MSAFELGPAILFCPADRPERYTKAAERADAVILDLEDAVAKSAKAQARKDLVANPLDPARTIVRVNPAGTDDFIEDLNALRRTDYNQLMLAKAEQVSDFDRLSGFAVTALCETARGVANATDIANVHGVVALMWGAEDLLASLGGTSSRFPDGQYREVAKYARSQVLIAAGSAHKAAIDSVFVNIPDLEGLRAESEDAVASGFAAKAAIHPNQVAVIRKAYAPSAEEVATARALLDAARASGQGVFEYQGSMVDGPILRHAESVVRRAKPAS